MALLQKWPRLIIKINTDYRDEEVLYFQQDFNLCNLSPITVIRDCCVSQQFHNITSGQFIKMFLNKVWEWKKA